MDDESVPSRRIIVPQDYSNLANWADDTGETEDVEMTTADVAPFGMDDNSFEATDTFSVPMEPSEKVDVFASVNDVAAAQMQPMATMGVSVGSEMNSHMQHLLSLTNDVQLGEGNFIGFSRSDVGRSLAAGLLAYATFFNVNREMYIRQAVQYMHAVELDRANRGKTDVQPPLNRLQDYLARASTDRVEVIIAHLKVLDIRFQWDREQSIRANLDRLDDDPRGRFMFSVPNLLGFAVLMVTAARPHTEFTVTQDVCETLEARLAAAGIVHVQKIRQVYKPGTSKLKVMAKHVIRFARKPCQLMCFNLTRMLYPNATVEDLLASVEVPNYFEFTPQDMAGFSQAQDRLICPNSAFEGAGMLPVLERPDAFVTPQDYHMKPIL